ncbi:MAG: aminotransferase [Gemmatimonadetes bacterium]|jgi:aspartate/methionine/tyrosine aminotransferase|nr:aminotransferase [Gemmatimonadota bacterium]MCH2452129.1 aminotransferase class I/II-fold pyridoxal phosphate-dependent enzyme [Gemmatimonadota bacterium]MEE2879937.1 aminotransferase class I/II-fold pyridoxal phosphate-dependent enzyme [Gemmatimonadota bacterium]
MKSERTAIRTHSFTESVIRDMTRVAKEHNAINLAQGFPDFPAPQLLKDAACDAINADINQYAVTWGTPSMRDALVDKYQKWYGMDVDGNREITVTCGGTEGMASVMLGVINPGDEVIILQPFYENYGPDAILCEAKPVFLTLEGPDFRLDPDRLASLITPKTRAIVVNTPNNPTGRVLDQDELDAIAGLCMKHDLLAITDEIYEHIYYEGKHIPMATMDGMRDRTITLSGLSKTFSVTGWRIGTIIAPPDLTKAIRKVHDFLTVGAPAPLQEACAVGLNELGEDYYSSMIHDYQDRREILYKALKDSGFKCNKPEGAYYILADFSDLSDETDDVFSRILARDAKVSPVPGSSFHSPGELGNSLVRFAFCKREETLIEAGDRLRHFAANKG